MEAVRSKLRRSLCVCVGNRMYNAIFPKFHSQATTDIFIFFFISLLFLKQTVWMLQYVQLNNYNNGGKINKTK